MNKMKLIFPVLLIVLNLGASLMCLYQKDYKKAVYWFAAAVLNMTVAF